MGQASVIVGLWARFLGCVPHAQLAATLGMPLLRVSTSDMLASSCAPVDNHISGLADAVRTVHALVVHAGVPGRVLRPPSAVGCHIFLTRILWFGHACRWALKFYTKVQCLCIESQNMRTTMTTRSAAVSVSPKPPTWLVSRNTGMSLVWKRCTRACRQNTAHPLHISHHHGPHCKIREHVIIPRAARYGIFTQPRCEQCSLAHVGTPGARRRTRRCRRCAGRPRRARPGRRR